MTVTLKIPNTSLLSPAHIVICDLAKSYLKSAGEAVTHLIKGDDREALHNYRVALRKLRNLFDLFGDGLPRPPGKKLLKQIRKAFSVTNKYRDAEVMLGWLTSIEGNLDHSEHWPQSLNLRQNETAFPRKLVKKVIKQFEKTQKNTNKLISKNYHHHGGVRFSNLLAQKLTSEASIYDKHLDRLKRHRQEPDIHQLRICGKGLRYLIEPVAQLLPNGPALASELTTLQDMLGDIHDCQVQLETLKRQKARNDRSPTELSLISQVEQQLLDRYERTQSQLKKQLDQNVFAAMEPRLSETATRLNSLRT